MIFDFVENLFRGSLASRLQQALEEARKGGYQVGKHVDCQLSGSRGPFQFHAGMETTRARNTDLNGRIVLFASKSYPDFRQAVASLTAEIGAAAAVAPSIQFFRVLWVGTQEDVTHYLSNHAAMRDKVGWLEGAVGRHDWRHARHYIRERFDAGSWTPYLAQSYQSYDQLLHNIVTWKAD